MKRFVKDLWLPDYDGKSLVNLANSVLMNFNVVPIHEPLGINSLPHVRKNMVLFVVDALGYGNLAHIEKNSEELKNVLKNFRREKLTSTFPTTTATALTSLVTGTYPVEHGMLGYIMYLDRFNTFANMINLSPIGFPRDILVSHGLNPSKFLPVKTIFQRLSDANVETWTVTSNAFKNSGLSKMHHQGSSIRGYSDIVEMFSQLKNLIRKSRRELFVFCYWGLSDMYGHLYGTSSEEYCFGIELLIKMLYERVICRLDKSILDDTVFMVTGDHGQINTSWKNECTLNTSDEMVREYFSMPPFGDSRTVYMNVCGKSGFKNYFSDRYGEKFHLLTRDECVEKALFGPISESNCVNGIIVGNNLRRTGNYVAIAHSRYSLNYKYTTEDRRQQGKHGSLTESEIFVPLLVFENR